jgi:hypothetical protein
MKRSQLMHDPHGKLAHAHHRGTKTKNKSTTGDTNELLRTEIHQEQETTN